MADDLGASRAHCEVTQLPLSDPSKPREGHASAPKGTDEMRRLLLICLPALLAVAPLAAAQQAPTSKGGETRRQEEQRQERIERQFARDQLPIPNLENDGPCPFVKVLYDASRITEFAGAQKSAATVAYSGEIEGLTAVCRYKEAQPITVEMMTTFAIGRGPAGTSENKTINYWIAVTDRNRAILSKQPFGFIAHFPKGSDRVMVFQHTDKITIPRAQANITGENFEVLVGFEVTPEQAAFNREGNRFLVNATGGPPPAAGAPAGR
jgi:hypothetical protein